MQHPTGKNPQRVALVAAGPTSAEWLYIMSGNGETFGVDEVWGINGNTNVLRCDLGFMMDDYAMSRGQDPGASRPYEIATVPIFTSVPRPNCPTAIPYPLAEVLSLPGVSTSMFNHTVCYAIAYAVRLGVKELLVFGADYFRSDRPYGLPQHAEQVARYMGMASYWLGYAAGQGMNVVVCPKSPLLDADVPEERHFYGYLIKPAVRREPERPRIRVAATSSTQEKVA
jgi:hypothetical protein